MRHGVTRVVLWCCLLFTCPSVAVAAAVRPAAAFLAALCGTPLVWLPAMLLVRDRPPLHRCPPRHARTKPVGVDTDTKLRVADIERRLNSEDRLWNLAEFLRRSGGQHKRDFHLIHGDGGDDDPENGDSEASLISLPAGA